MATIIAGGFDVVTDADAAVARLKEAGVGMDDMCTFGIVPAGEHHALPAGGDRQASPGAKGAGKGAGTGAAIGAVAGLAAGAYAGSLVGALKRMDREPQPGHESVRPAETLIAVNVDAGPLAPDDVVRIFEECGARQVERTQGRWENGEWADFDPLCAPHLVGGRDQRKAAGATPPPPR